MTWLTNGHGGSITPGHKANIVQYVYHPGQPGKWGDKMRWDSSYLNQTAPYWREFKSGRWYQIRHRVVMNTPGQEDGVMMAWLDGKLVLNRRDIRYRDIDSLQIDQLKFSTFFGGNHQSFATTKDEYAYFDDFTIYAVVPGTRFHTV